MSIEVKNRLKEVLKEKGVTQTELVRYTGTSNSTISNIVNQRFLPSLDLALDIAKYLSVHVDDIFYKEDKEKEELIEFNNSLKVLKGTRRDYMSGIMNEGIYKAMIDMVVEESVNTYGKENFYLFIEKSKDLIDEHLYKDIMDTRK